MKHLTSCLYLAAVSVLTNCTALNPSASQSHQLNSDVSPDQALALLKAGNERYVSGRHASQDNPSERRATLAKGQKPFAVVIGCADSRTAPEIIFDQQLGSLFVCRVAGNVTDPVVLGSVEYAVEHLHAPLIVVLGHSKCGAVSAALAGGHAPGNIGSLLEHVHTGSGLPADKDAKTGVAVSNNTVYQKKTITANSEIIRKFVKERKVRVASGVYSLDTGSVTWQ